MKLGLIAALTGIAVAIGLSRKKRPQAVPVPARNRDTALDPNVTRNAPVTGTAPQEGISP